MAKRRSNGEGDVCERCRRQMKRAKRSGRNTGIDEQPLCCEVRADVATGNCISEVALIG